MEVPDRLAAAATPAVIPRASWGADESLRQFGPLFAPIRQFFIHHTVTANNDGDPAGTIRGIYRNHLSQGFHDIGYNFLIDAGGNVYEGRYARSYAAGEQPSGQSAAGLGVVGAHVAGHNVAAVGIGLLGDFSRANPAGASLNSLVNLLAWLAAAYGLDPTASNGGVHMIAGHRDANQTSCPGDDLYGQLPAIRGAVAARMDSNALAAGPPGPTCVQVLPGGVSGTQTPRVTGQVSRAAARVDVQFAGSGLLAQRTIPVVPTAGAFAVEAANYTVIGLPPGTYSIQAVAYDGGGRVSGPTAVASGYRVVSTPLPAGFWVLGSDGGIFSYGGATFYGSTGGMPLNKPVIGMASTPGGDGYWLVASDGGIFAFGAAHFAGSTGGIRLNKSIVGISTSATGRGYRLVASDGGIFSFGDAQFFGSTGSLRLNSPIVGMAGTPSGAGYRLVAADGGLFNFGDAGFHGSAAGQALNKPIVGIEPMPSGQGYWLVGGDGAVFSFGDARFFGSGASGPGLGDPNVIRLAATPTGAGYYLLDTSGQVMGFGDAPVYGSPLGMGLEVDAIGMTIRA